MRYVIHETYQYVEEYEVDAADEHEAQLLHNAGVSEHVRQSAAPERVRLSANRFEEQSSRTKWRKPEERMRDYGF